MKGDAEMGGKEYGSMLKKGGREAFPVLHLAQKRGYRFLVQSGAEKRGYYRGILVFVIVYMSIFIIVIMAIIYFYHCHFLHHVCLNGWDSVATFLHYGLFW